MTNVENAWTVVQHSGYGYKGNPQFKLAVETRKLSTLGEMKRVERSGGCIFSTYLDAENFAEQANYPPGYKGIVPSVRGGFSSQMIDGLRIYKPIRSEPIG